MTVKEFIERVLLNQFIEIQQKHKYYYISFSLIGLGIELLGACLDNYNFDQEGKSEERFTNAIKELFPSEYHTYNNDKSDPYLYEHLRCGFAHQIRPGKKIALTHKAESQREKTEHLTDYKGRLVLVAEDLFEHFEEACKKVIKKIDSGELKHKKLHDEFLLTKL